MPRSAAARKGYVRIRQGPWRLWLHKDFQTLSEPMPADGQFDGVRGPFQRIPSSAYARVFKASLNLSGQIHQLYIKQYLYRSPLDFVKHLFRLSRAMRSLKGTLLLARNGFSAPPIIAVGEDRRLVVCTRCFVLTSSVQHAPPVHAWLANLPAMDRHERRRRRALIRGLGETVGRMHARGIFHGDLRPGNVLAAQGGDNWTYHLLDNERTRAYRRLPRHLRMKNLIQIGMLTQDYISTTDRMRFLKAYLKKNPSLIGHHKRLAAAVMTRTRQRLAGKVV
jgi:tRNA A-37 threonylcarbamoyl transferase component Bud32